MNQNENLKFENKENNQSIELCQEIREWIQKRKVLSSPALTAANISVTSISNTSSFSSAIASSCTFTPTPTKRKGHFGRSTFSSRQRILQRKEEEEEEQDTYDIPKSSIKSPYTTPTKQSRRPQYMKRSYSASANSSLSSSTQQKKYLHSSSLSKALLSPRYSTPRKKGSYAQPTASSLARAAISHKRSYQKVNRRISFSSMASSRAGSKKRRSKSSTKQKVTTTNRRRRNNVNNRTKTPNIIHFETTEIDQSSVHSSITDFTSYVNCRKRKCEFVDDGIRKKRRLVHEFVF